MADRAITDALRDQVFKRLGAVVALASDAEETRDRFLLARSRLLLQLELNGVLSQFRLSGIRIGENTHASGVIYLRVFDETPGAGQARVRGYLSTADRAADTNHVFSAEGADGATLTVNEANSSGIGLTGSGDQVVIGTVAANDQNPHLYCLIPWREHVGNIFGREIDDRLDDDQDVRDAVTTVITQMRGDYETARLRAISLLNTVIARTIRTEFDVAALAPLGISRTVDASTGAVSLQFAGVLPETSNHMEDNTAGAGEIDVRQHQTTAGAVTADPDNAGVGTVSVQLLSQALPGTVTIRLVKEFDEVGLEEFVVEQSVDDLPGVQIRGTGRARVGAVYRDLALGIQSLTISRTFTKSGDGGDTDFAAGSALTNMSGETTLNTAAGRLGLEIVANASNWDIHFHSTTDTSQFTTATRVASALDIATAAVFTATQVNSSGLEITWQLGSGPAAGAKAYHLDINQWEVQEQNDSLVADAFTFVISLGTDRGRFNRLLSRRLQFALNADAAGGETVDENFARANTVLDLLQDP